MLDRIIILSQRYIYHRRHCVEPSRTKHLTQSDVKGVRAIILIPLINVLTNLNVASVSVSVLTLPDSVPTCSSHLNAPPEINLIRLTATVAKLDLPLNQLRPT